MTRNPINSSLFLILNPSEPKLEFEWARIQFAFLSPQATFLIVRHSMSPLIVEIDREVAVLASCEGIINTRRQFCLMITVLLMPWA